MHAPAVPSPTIAILIWLSFDRRRYGRTLVLLTTAARLNAATDEEQNGPEMVPRWCSFRGEAGSMDAAGVTPIPRIRRLSSNTACDPSSVAQFRNVCGRWGQRGGCCGQIPHPSLPSQEFLNCGDCGGAAGAVGGIDIHHAPRGVWATANTFRREITD